MNPIKTLGPTELRAALPYLLTAPGSSPAAARDHVPAFCDYLTQGGVKWEGLRCGRLAAPSGLFVALLLPGRTAIVMIPTPGMFGIDAARQLVVTAAGLDRLAGQGLHFAQALLEPEATAKRVLLEHAGFRPLAPLDYLERDVSFPWAEPPRPDEVQWVRYSVQSQAEFAAVVLATYENSLDCPELTGLRPIEDILASHRASGQFDPALWDLARINGETAGCLLLSRVAQAPMVEIVYMGVVAAHRRRGVGKLLLRRALDQCRAIAARRLSVVVDNRNDPARQLYERFAFTPVARRDAYLYQWK